MSPVLEAGLSLAFMGLAGAGLMDVWGFVLRRGFGVATLDYGLLGRWIGHFPRLVFVHRRIAAADPVPLERPLGLLAHYAIGIAFAVPVLLVWGTPVENPTLLPAMGVGLLTIAAPWLVMQPAMGAGFAGARTPNPWATRLRNLGSHAAYGLGLYLAGVLLAAV